MTMHPGNNYASNPGNQQGNPARSQENQPDKKRGNSPASGTPGGVSIWLIAGLLVIVCTTIAWIMVSNMAAARTEYDYDIPKISNQVGHIENRLTGLDALTNNQVSKLGGLKDDTGLALDEVNDRVYDAEGQISELNSKVDTTRSELVSTFETQIGSLRDNMTASIATKAEKTALDVKADKTDLNTKADKTALDVKADKTALTNLETRVSSITFSVQSGIIDATYDQDRFIWTSDGTYQVTRITFQQSAIETTSASTTLALKKVANGSVIGSGTDLLSTVVNLKTSVTANIVLVATLNSTTSNLLLAIGDSIALDFTNGLTQYVGCVTVTLKKI